MQTLPHASSCLEPTVTNSSMISIFITNLGKYNGGDLVGEWLELPTTSEQVKQCLEQIGIDGVNYEEFFLTSYESSVYGVSNYISEYSNLDELSHDDIEIYDNLFKLSSHFRTKCSLYVCLTIYYKEK